jgi:membrane protease YdiL (CAAX protease family)
MTWRGRLIGWTSIVAALSALNYVSRATEGKPPRDVLYQYSAAIGGFVQYGLILVIVLALARGPGMHERLALRAPRSWRRAAVLGLIALIAVYTTGGILQPFLDAGKEQGLTPKSWDPDRAPAFAANFVVIAGLAPIVEELTFRGLGFHILRRLGQWPAIVLTGLAFGLAHGLLEGLPVLVVFGAALAFLRSRTGSIYPGILVHSAFNAIALTVAVTT